MLEELHIRGLGVIEDTSLVLGPGLTVITGETGAGKTMLVTALQLLLGGRASADLVRRGVDTAVIEAVVRVPTLLGLDATAGDADPDTDPDADPDDGSADDSGSVRHLWDLAEDGVLIVTREIPTSGRSRARVGGRLVPPSVLGQLLGPHVEIHGQHEHVRLEQPAVQRRLLDGYGDADHAASLATYREAHAAWAAADRRRRMLAEDAASRARRLDLLRAERAEIDAAMLDADRDEQLDVEIDRLAHADALRGALEAARTAAGPEGALEGVGEAVAALRRTPVEDPAVSELAERLAALSRDLSEVVADVAALAEEVGSDDERLDALQVRKREVAALQRRFGATVEAVLAHRAQADAEIADLEALEDDAESIATTLAAALEARDAAGRALTASREAVGERLSKAVLVHLADLGLQHAMFSVALAPLREPGPDGADRVTLLLAANPGEAPARLGDAASGGERSRVALALEVVLTAATGHEVLVFDEVDAGVGGSTALAVGEKLARLASEATAGEAGTPARQVLCVTHLPQVAAYADSHHLVEKSVKDGRTLTTVSPVAEDGRALVLSRMLGGEATADAGLEHARGLLQAARSRRGA